MSDQAASSDQSAAGAAGATGAAGAVDDGKLAFELASPEALLLSIRADMVVVPGAEGNFGVLPGHAPFISEVRPGVIDVYIDDKIDERIFVAGGFAEVNEQGCTVLSSEAYPLEDLDKGEVEDRRRDAEEQLANADDDDDDERRAAESEIALCDAMLTALE